MMILSIFTTAQAYRTAKRHRLSLPTLGERGRHCVAAALDSAALDAGPKRAVSVVVDHRRL
jgi:hypothetical protein